MKKASLASLYQKNKIIEYLKSKGYINSDDRRFSLYLDGRKSGEWERNIHVTILRLRYNEYEIVAELKVFQNIGSIHDYIHVQRNITCLEDILFMEQSMDKLIEMRSYFFNVN